ncbi:type 2 isopentenyl-diphosphate Delta-isomerase [Calidifontibacillus erzurumensis]|uniref:Isopentenyl-diphosphate delta-isomerase n=1 Tax=Calidifontibacillus erzurumensis TaxID=2741433 RepID=A0A8J8KCT5_9BACI|nr:type 2 isopentenyl-diphosphate Delta-isomerase [Calidifontibacillus erzurumensis]NSL52313.1 type 2 isopentenyl-diphosphate Delta-isomerase [Calidifontibacillus erzurumensis]
MSRTGRKLDHIHHALTLNSKRSTGLDDIQFVHNSIPDLSVRDISLNTKIGELTLSSPIFINAMTGGGGSKTVEINRCLARVAKECQLAMALGSQMAAIKDKNEIQSYRVVREENPNGIILANLGSEATLDEAKQAIEMVDANALQIHLNVIQELTMPEGDRHFTGTLNRIEMIVKNLQVPVIIKEVGFGMSCETARQLKNIGISIFDVGGFGGTNFAEIENLRRGKPLTFFNEWGIPTAASIVEVCSVNPEAVIASGGLKESIDIAKSIALGASACGLAGQLLKVLMIKGVEGVIQEVKTIESELKIIMAALGTKTIEELKQVPLVISGSTYHWLEQRGIETKKYSQR